MTEPIVRTVIADLAEARAVVGQTFAGLGRELAELGQDPARTRQCLVAALVVPLATTIALLLEVESPWWAGISGFMSLMSTGAGSVRRGGMRMTGTIAGAAIGFFMARWLPYDHFALCLFLAATTMVGVIAMQVSPHGLSWLFLCITSNMVLLIGLNDPTRVYEIAFYRVFDVAIGVATAIVMANLLHDWHGDPPPTPPGWRHLLGAQWPSTLHGIRSAIAVVVVLQVWILIDLPDVYEMAVTVAVVMSAPVILDGSGLGTRHAVAVRSLHRFIGCLLGGLVALGCLALSVESFPWWLAIVGGGVWVGTHIQSGKHGVGYVGTQAAFVFVVTMIQGPAPPDSLLPGLDRFAGITGGLGILFVVSLLLWPTEAQAEAARKSG